MTDSTPHPTPGSPSEYALQIFRSAYGGGDGIGLRPDDGLNPGIVLLFNQTNYTVDTPTLAKSRAMREFSKGLQRHLEENLPVLPTPKEDKGYVWSKWIQRPIPHKTQVIDPIVNVTSYYSIRYGERLPQAAKGLMSQDGRATVMYVSFSIPTLAYAKTGGPSSSSPHNVLKTYSSSILNSILEYCQVGNEWHDRAEFFNTDLVETKSGWMPPNVTLGYTGILPFQEDMRVNLSQDLHRMHVYVLPLSLLILSIVLDGHFGLIVITVLSVGCVVAASSWVMIWAIWSGWVEGVSQFTPNVMVCLSFGLGIDYT